MSVNVAFMTSNVIIFFMFFEFIVIPMYFLIMVYGNREWEKIRAVNLLLLFTICSGMFMLIGLIKMYVEIGSVNATTLYYIGLGSNIR